MADPTPPPAPLPYTPAVRAGDWLVVSGQIGLAEGRLVDGGVLAELRQLLANLAGHLEANGAALTDVVRCGLFLTDMADFAAVNEVYAEFFGDHRPARTAVAVAALPLGASVEVEAWAWTGGRR